MLSRTSCASHGPRGPIVVARPFLHRSTRWHVRCSARPARRFVPCSRCASPNSEGETPMFVPFGTHVVDRNGKTVGAVSRLVLHPQAQEVVALVVQQGVLNRREVVIPLN